MQITYPITYFPLNWNILTFFYHFSIGFVSFYIILCKLSSFMRIYALNALLLKLPMIISVKKTLKTLIKSVQNWLISNKIILPRKFPWNWPFFTDCFSVKLAPKIAANLSLKIRKIWLFFLWPIRSPVVWCDPTDLIVWKIMVRSIYCLCDLAHFCHESKAR